jgi:hypothetical protein
MNWNIENQHAEKFNRNGLLITRSFPSFMSRNELSFKKKDSDICFICPGKLHAVSEQYHLALQILIACVTVILQIAIVD